MKKTCRRCKEAKGTGEFHRCASARDGLAYECKPCRSVINREYRQANLESIREYDRLRSQDPTRKAKAKTYQKVGYARRSAANPEKYREQSLRGALKKYGLTVEDYDRMYAEQDGKCAVCREPSEKNQRRLHVDHCHKTGRVRGLLCVTCNVGLGSFGDNLDRVFAAAAYLLEHEDVLEAIS